LNHHVDNDDLCDDWPNDDEANSIMLAESLNDRGPRGGSGCAVFLFCLPAIAAVVSYFLR